MNINCLRAVQLIRLIDRQPKIGGWAIGWYDYSTLFEEFKTLYDKLTTCELLFVCNKCRQVRVLSNLLYYVD